MDPVTPALCLSATRSAQTRSHKGSIAMPDLTNAPPLRFPKVYLEEQAEITIRRRRQFYADDQRVSHDCVGLALSGGGIRSATFCLGFLQELSRLKLLRIFDYLSTVSGGGYVG